MKYVVWHRNYHAFAVLDPNGALHDTTREIDAATRFTKEMIDNGKLDFPNKALVIMPAPEWLEEQAFTLLDNDEIYAQGGWTTNSDYNDYGGDPAWLGDIDEAKGYTLKDSVELGGLLAQFDGDEDWNIRHGGHHVITLDQLELPKHMTPVYIPHQEDNDALALRIKALTNSEQPVEPDPNQLTIDDPAAEVTANEPGDAIKETIESAFKDIMAKTKREVWTVGFGRAWNVYAADKCTGSRCPIHKKTEHHMSGWMQTFDLSEQIMVRVCKHDVWHPDPDDRATEGRAHLYPHSCCAERCCWPQYMNEEDPDAVA